MTESDTMNLTAEPLILEALPDSIVAWQETRAEWARTHAQAHGGLEWVVSDIQRWAPGDTLRVAFLGGSADVCEAIGEVLREIEGACNIRFDLGFDPVTRTYRSWSEDDQGYAADIRVSFDLPGYFSLVGTDCINAQIGDPGDRVGGRPWQCTLNLGGYAAHRPADWRGTVLHEFLHALAFHHEHTSASGPCQEEFRWDDDPGYVPTTSARGEFLVDAAGRRPGIYTYLSGHPNYWPRAKVDHNLRPSAAEGIQQGPFDRASVMLYRFPSLFYRTQNSPCAPLGTGQALSAGDIEGLQRLYPHAAPAVEQQIARLSQILESLGDDGLEAISSPFATSAARSLERNLRGLVDR